MGVMKLIGSFLLVSLFHSNLLLTGVAADQIITSSGSTFGRSSREPRFNIEFHSANSPFHPENGQESVVMTNKEGKTYTCFLPKIEETKTIKSNDPQNSSNIVVESDRKILKTPDELLELLKDQCFYRHEGWWSYELCYQQKIRQVHVEEEKVVQEFVLGEFDADATSAYNEKHSDSSLLKDPRSRDASQRYHAHQYTNGTLCDLTDVPRETEVRFVCSGPQVMISSIKEISSCKYVITVQSPMLCKHPMFQQERPTLNIHCNEFERESSVQGNQKGTRITVIGDESESFAT